MKKLFRLYQLWYYYNNKPFIPTLITYWRYEEFNSIKLDETKLFIIGGTYGPITKYNITYLGIYNNEKIYKSTIHYDYI